MDIQEALSVKDLLHFGNGNGGVCLAKRLIESFLHLRRKRFAKIILGLNEPLNLRPQRLKIYISDFGKCLRMSYLPWWRVGVGAAEGARLKKSGAKGSVRRATPHDAGRLYFAQPEWRPFWELCEALEMPINFHIGASEGDINWSGSVPYDTWPGDVKISLGGAAIFRGQLRWMVNLLVSDVPERYPNLNFVSVESGVGWIPFLLDAPDYQCGETAPEHLAHLSMKPSEYFRRQFYGCFWFESKTLAPAVEHIGPDRIMFETDIPHPTCLYPHSVERVREAIGQMAPEVQKKILQDNAAELYGIKV